MECGELRTNSPILMMTQDTQARSRRVLAALIREYIATGEPVASALLVAGADYVGILVGFYRLGNGPGGDAAIFGLIYLARLRLRPTSCN